MNRPHSRTGPARRLFPALGIVLLTAGAFPLQGRTEGEEGEAEPHTHHLSIFLGVTDDDEDDSFTCGADYEYRFHRRLGIGGLVDYAGGDIRSTVWGVPVVIHPAEGWKILAGPGLEHHSGENEFLVRIGAMYDFEIGRYTLAPAINIDFVDGEEIYVYGVNFGRGW